MQAKYHHSQNIFSEIHGSFGYSVNFGVNIRSNCLHNFPTSSTSARIRQKFERANSNSSLPNSIYPFKNLIEDTRIWVCPLEFLSDSGWSGGSWEIVETVGPDIYSKIHRISKTTVNFGAECSANGGIWLAHSTSTVF